MALTNAASHQFDINDLMIVDIEVHIISERSQVPLVRRAVLGLKD